MSFVIEEEAIERLPISIDPEVMSGTPVFEGTRVPVDALLITLLPAFHWTNSLPTSERCAVNRHWRCLIFPARR
jgi:hypothetical protein